jgi:hypothetical protein
MTQPKTLDKDYEDTMTWMESFLSSTDTSSTVPPSPLTSTTCPSPTQYRISDPIDSDDESENDEPYDPNATEIRGQEIPEWAHSTNVLAALQSQQIIDPDLIFTNFDKTCDLMQMFEKKKRTFKVRGDSGWWVKDALTPTEEVNYKKAIGLA